MEIEINEYACAENWSPIKCIFKRLYSDFIVTEISKEDKVLMKPTEEIAEKLPSFEQQNNQQEENIDEIPDEFQANKEDFDKIMAGEIDQCVVDTKVKF